jgi:hypothetical protein
MAKRMVKENYNLMMEDIMQDNGKITRCMVMVGYIIRMDKLLTKATGKMINFLGLEEFLMIGLKK